MKSALPRTLKRLHAYNSALVWLMNVVRQMKRKKYKITEKQRQQRPTTQKCVYFSLFSSCCSGNGDGNTTPVWLMAHASASFHSISLAQPFRRNSNNIQITSISGVRTYVCVCGRSYEAVSSCTATIIRIGFARAKRPSISCDDVRFTYALIGKMANQMRGKKIILIVPKLISIETYSTDVD